MKKIVVSMPLPGEALSRVQERGFQLVVLPEARSRQEWLAALDDETIGMIALLSDPVGEDVLARVPNLRGIANYAVGFNNIDLAACSRRGIPVTNTPDVLTEATADLTMTLILLCLRRIPEATAYLAAGRFDGWKPELLLGFDPRGKTLGIIGMGRIGQATAKRAEAFGMRIAYFTSSGTRPDLPYSSQTLEEILAGSDVLSLHVPLTPATKHLLDEKRLLKMKRGAILINTARGPVVHEEALAKVLRQGHLFGAGLDVYEEEPKVHPGLSGLPNVVLLPHVGSATWETRSAMADLAVDSLLAILDGKRPGNVVNHEVFIDRK
jgi:glyoxylate reductase